MEFVSWDDEIPNGMESQNPFMFQSPPTSFRSFQNSQNVAPQAASPWHLESWLRGCAGAVPSLAQRRKEFPNLVRWSFGGNHRFNEIQIGMENQTWHLVILP